MLSCNIGNYLIKRQSERYIIIAVRGKGNSVKGNVIFNISMSKW